MIVQVWFEQINAQCLHLDVPGKPTMPKVQRAVAKLAKAAVQVPQIVDVRVNGKALHEALHKGK